MMPLISIVTCTYNDELYIDKFMISIVNLNYQNWELIIIDDCSTDNTAKKIKQHNDTRVKYYRQDYHSENIAGLRNKGIKLAIGEYIFITDTDCFVDKDWLTLGLQSFSESDTLAMEGKIIYVKKNYKCTLSEYTGLQNYQGGLWMTANMAYKREIFNNFEFNNKYKRLSDRELALRINKTKKIVFNPKAIVYHQNKKRTIKSYLKEADRLQYKVMLIKELKDTEGVKFKILNLKFFLVAIFPILIFAEIFWGRIKTLQDLKLLPFVWIKAIYMRYIIWRTAIKEHVFVI